MSLLLDTHAVIWWFNGSPALSPRARSAIDDSDETVFVSAVSAFEIALRHRLGKLPQADALAARFEIMSLEQGFQPLAVSVRHALAAGAIAVDHRDPFDRLLMAQALVENLTLVSNERAFDAAGVERLW